MNKPEKIAQREIEELLKNVINRFKLPLLNGALSLFGLEKISKSIVGISQKYVESKLREAIGKYYVLKIEENRQEV